MQSIRHLMQLSRPFGQQILRNIIGTQQRGLCTNDANGNGVRKPVISIVESSPAMNNTAKKGHELQINWDEEMRLIEEDEQENSRSILAPVEDESTIYAEPMLRPTFNLAAYAQKSETLQQLMKLGVNLGRLDEKGVGEFIIRLDFKRDIEPYILFLTKDVGMPIEEMGKFLTRNPLILKESPDDIHVRINYLELKRFNQSEIISIITRNPCWLNYETRTIDERLGFFQKDFELTGNQVRLLTLTYPKIITHDMDGIKCISFSIREECCFEKHEVKQILLKCPKIWTLHRLNFMERYDYVSHYMKIENSQLAKTPLILNNRLFRIKERHGFLKKIKRAQYNPKLPLYISLDDLVIGTDEEFAEKVAKKPYEEYDRYLRTL